MTHRLNNDYLNSLADKFFGDSTGYDLGVEEESIGDALKNNISHPFSKSGDAIWERTGEVSETEAATYGPVQAPRKEYKITSTDKFDDIASIDFAIERTYRSIQRQLDSLHLPGDKREQSVLKAIQAFIGELDDGSATVSNMDRLTREDVTFKDAFLERCNRLRAEMQETAVILKKRVGSTGVSTPQQGLSAGSTISNPREFDNASIDPQLDQRDSLALLAAFIVVLLSVFGSLVREWANAALQLHLALLSSAYARLRPEGPSAFDSDILKTFPRDIRTARKIFELEPATVTYAACPRCSTLYHELPDGQYPLLCSARRFPDSTPCDATISKLAVQDSKKGTMKRIPVRPYVIQDFDAFKASLLNRPGMEALLDRGTVFNTSHDLWDLKDGTTTKELKGSDGKQFLDGLLRHELRLMWALSIDWFNPFLNKQAGRTVSTGSVVMSCLNLPPSLRYKAENLYVVGIIPGPREPSVDDIDHFLEPIVDFLDRSWRDGTRFSQTESSPSGRTERSILAVVIADLPGARKITGAASHSSQSFFCSLCRLSKQDINNFDVDSWPTISNDDRRKAAHKWRNAPNQATRRRLFQETGIRWSSLWKLDYFDPTKMVIVDAMHNLFLGLVQFHVREVLGIDSPRSDVAAPAIPADEDMLVVEQAFLAADWERLKKVSRVPTLQLLCQQKGISINTTKLRAPKKHMLEKLQAFHSSNAQSSDPGRNDLADLIGGEYVDECQSERPEIFVDVVTKTELDKIRKDILSAIRPQYRQGPPSNLGEASHGKLRASQWKSAIEFDLPISVAKHWSKEVSFGHSAKDRRDQFFECIMHLAIAIRWGTSYRTSSLHAARFKHHMQLYLRSLCELYPNIRLRPNHHSALHIAQNLLQFGPVHGWWMFPFERVIGKLQKVKTNHKLGEMETTMFKSFCAGAKLKALVEGEGCPKALLPAAPIIKNHFLRAHVDYEASLQPADRVKAQKTTNGIDGRATDPGAEMAFREGFLLHSGTLKGCRSPFAVKYHKHIVVGGVAFSTYTASHRDAEISFCPTGENEWVPGVIDTISSMESKGIEVFTLGVRRRKPLDPASRVPDPFARFPDFGAKLWSEDLDRDPTFIPLTKPIYHTQRMAWVNRAVVIKEIKLDF